MSTEPRAGEERAEVGWGWPGLARKAHCFIGSRSLCGKWMFFGYVENEGSEKPSKDDCVACRRLLTEMEARDAP